MKKMKRSKKSLITLLIFSMLVIGLSSCQTKVIPQLVTIPTLDIVRPVAPVLEAVQLTTPVPPTLLRNYNALASYSFDLEDYAWGGKDFGGLEKYIKDIAEILNQKQLE